MYAKNDRPIVDSFKKNPVAWIELFGETKTQTTGEEHGHFTTTVSV